MSEIILGIDLGTTNSVASIWDGTKYIIIKNNNSNLFPSIIEFTEKGKIICNSNYNLNNSIKNIKRFIGQNLENVKILNFLSDLNFNYNIIENKIKIYNEYEKKFYTLEELNSLILKFIVSKASRQLNINIKDVIITIPAHFNQIQRDSIIISAKLANLNCLRIINEPTAASLAYGLNMHDDLNVLIFDLGGGTFDLSILNIDDGIHEVLATQGDNMLGGEDFTKVILNDVIDNFKCTYADMKDDIINKQINKLKYECEKFKCGLVESIIIKNFYLDDNINLDLVYNKKRNEISNLFNSLFDRITEHLGTILPSANLQSSEIDYVILVGGSTKLIEVKNCVEIYFDKKKIISNINPDLVVSIGAAIQGFILKNPDNKFSQNIALVDVLPLSIGVESDDGIMTKIIKKNTKLPIKHTKIFTNEDDYQEEVEIKIFQGERSLVKDNILIGNFKLNNLQQKLRGKNIICVEIKVDNNCMIEVTAFEKNTDNKSKITIKKEDVLYDEKTIQDMISDADKYDEIDNFKYKLHKNFNKLKFDLKNLEYNHNNEFINLNEDDIINLNKHIEQLKYKMNEITPFFKRYDLNNNDYIDLIQKVKKLLKINNKKYPMLTQFYDNEKNKDLVIENTNVMLDEKSKEYNIKMTKIINTNINSINNLNKISKYSKKNIISYLQNLKFKFDSITLDEELFNDFISEIKCNTKSYIDNDQELINMYGNLNTINNLLNNNSINYDLTKFYNLNSLEIFDLLFDICQQFNLQIN